MNGAKMKKKNLLRVNEARLDIGLKRRVSFVFRRITESTSAYRIGCGINSQHVANRNTMDGPLRFLSLFYYL
jgi:hypothetical protein